MSDDPRLGLPSASAMEIIQACPGMLNLKNSIPKEQLTESTVDDEWSKRGTRIHHAFQTENTLELDEEEYETYAAGVKYQEQILAKWKADKVLSDAEVEEGPREMRVYLHSQTHFPDVIGSAQLDRHWIARQRGLILVTDLKSGWNPNLPTPARSWQLMFQGLSLWREEYDWAKEVRVAYVKAKDKHEFHDHCDYEESHLKMAWDSITFALWQSTQPDAQRHAGKHCRWCVCRAWCREAMAFGMLPSVVANQVLIGEKPKDATDAVSLEDLRLLWEDGSTIRAILEAVLNRLKGMSDEDLAKVSLTHGKGKERHVVTDVHGAFEHLQKLYGYDEKELWPMLDFVNGRLAAIAQEKKAINKKEATAWVKEVLEKFITKKEDDKPIVAIK